MLQICPFRSPKAQTRPLSDAEVSLLKKGFNFAITPSNIPAIEIVTKVESAMRTLDSEHADTIRRTVNGILQQAKPPKANITKEMQEALKNLKQDDTIIILPADKGRFSVVLDTDTLSLKRSGHQSEIIYNKTKPRHQQPPRIYGLPKIHKPDIPLGPIVSCLTPLLTIFWLT